MISDEEKEKVRQATDVLQLFSENCELKPRGNTYWACCPFHHEKSPSFHVNPDTGFWKCFGCGLSGDVFSYVMKRENLDFIDAIRYLAERAHIELHEDAQFSKGPKKSRILELLAAAEQYYQMMLLRGRGQDCDAARAYVKGRGFNQQVCKHWHLGFAPARSGLVAELRRQGYTLDEIQAADLAFGSRDRFFNRVMFPIHNEHGHCIGFGGRVLSDEKPKYLNTAETLVFHKSKNMYAYDKAREFIVAKNQAIVVEGYTDVIALHEVGFNNVVATLGTALTSDHVKLLSRFANSIIFMFDGDGAGQKAADRALKFLNITQAQLMCVILPDNLDPQEFVDQKGADALQAQLDAAQPLIDFVFENRLRNYDLTIPGQKVKAFNELCSLLSVFKDTVLLDEYATRLAYELKVDKESARQGIMKAKPLFAEKRQMPDQKPDFQAYQPYKQVSRQNKSEAAQSVYFSKEDRYQIAFEKELLSLLATYPEQVKAYADDISNIAWLDSNHRNVADVLLKTDRNASSKEMAHQALTAFPQAGSYLVPGQLSVIQDMPLDAKVSYLLLNIEIFTNQRRIQEIKGMLTKVTSGEAANKLLQETHDLTRRNAELSASMANL